MLVLAIGVWGAPAPASARSEALRWSHPSPSTVRGFRVYWGTQAGRYSHNVDAGLPARDPAGNFVYQLNVPASGTIFIAVSAYDSAGRESALSNSQARSAAPAPVGGPAPGVQAPAPAPAGALGRPGKPQLLSD